MRGDSEIFSPARKVDALFWTQPRDATRHII